MGLEQSRQENLPGNISTSLLAYAQYWSADYLSNFKTNKSEKSRATLSDKTLNLAGEHICKFLTKTNLSLIKILEPFAGNGFASKIIYNNLVSKFPDVIIKSTDVQDLTEYVDENSHPVEFNLNSVQTIEKFKFGGFNVLMMISPPPLYPIFGTKKYAGYADFWALEKFYEVSTGKYFIFIGELGASDGSEGMYKYLLGPESKWKLELRVMLYKTTDITGGSCEKELFIFSKRG